MSTLPARSPSPVAPPGAPAAISAKRAGGRVWFFGMMVVPLAVVGCSASVGGPKTASVDTPCRRQAIHEGICEANEHRCLEQWEEQCTAEQRQLEAQRQALAAQNAKAQADREAQERAALEATHDAEQRRLEEERQRQAALAALRTPVPEAVGRFEWSNAAYGKGEGCEMWSSQRLSVTVATDGSVTWDGFRNGDGACEGRPMVPTNCGASGHGYLTRQDGRLLLVTSERGAYGGMGAEARVTVWQCGTLKVRSPLNWEPPRGGVCTRLGTEEDWTEATASAAACAYAPPFPELDERGAPVEVSGEKLLLTLGAKQVTFMKVRE